MSRSTLRIATLWLLLIITPLLGCGRSRQGDLDDVTEAFSAASTRPGLILVEARLETASQLVIDRAALAPGAAPRLLDDPDLGGRIELLDEARRPLWTMGYRPLDFYEQGEHGEQGARLSLRAPLIDGAVTVRLSEAGTKRETEAPIER